MVRDTRQRYPLVESQFDHATRKMGPELNSSHIFRIVRFMPEQITWVNCPFSPHAPDKPSRRSSPAPPGAEQPDKTELSVKVTLNVSARKDRAVAPGQSRHRDWATGRRTTSNRQCQTQIDTGRHFAETCNPHSAGDNADSRHSARNGRLISNSLCLERLPDSPHALTWCPRFY